MTICNFFLQGRCRYGDKCWNEHPRGGNRGGGGGGGGGGYNNRSSTQQQSRGGGGFGNKVWVNPDQQKGSYIKASSFSSHGGDDWGRGGQGGSDWGRGGGGNDWGRGGGGGGGGRDNVKSYEFSFSSQNRFSSLDTPTTFDRGGSRGGAKPGGDEEDDKQLEIIQKDMEVWENSGQWCLSCYSNSLAPLSGFTDVSPEEVRLEYYSTRPSGDLQGYINGVNQLLNQWRSRIQELKVMNLATRTALLTELNNPAPQASSSGFGTMTATGFGSTTSGFGSKDVGFGSGAPVQASSFSFAATSGGFGASSSSSSSSAGFGSATAAPTQPPSGFGSTSAPSPSSFSFTAAATNKPAPATSGFGSASGFSFSTSANAGGGFGTGFGTDAPAAAAAAAGGSSSLFGQKSGGFGAPAAGSAGEALDSLFSSEGNLTPEELNQFRAKRFTLGQIPLKAPPANMLII